MGAALVVAGSFTGALAISKLNKLDNNCEGPYCALDDRQLQSSTDKLAIATDILIPTGATFAVTGMILLIINKKKNSSPENIARVSALIKQQHAGLILEGRF